MEERDRTTKKSVFREKLIFDYKSPFLRLDMRFNALIKLSDSKFPGF
jgi:hypothetical protein